MNRGPATHTKTRVQRRSRGCSPGTMKPQSSISHSGEVPTMAAIEHSLSCSISGLPTPVITASDLTPLPSMLCASL